MSPGTSNDPPESAELETISSRMAYETFLSAAKAVEPGLLEECCSDIVLVYHNVLRGVEGVLGSGAVLVSKLPNVNVVELSMLPQLVQGLAFCALQAQRDLQTASFGKLFERAQQMRRKLRKTADALAEAGLLPEADADEVRLHGQQDVLDDSLALVSLFRRNEARIAGRSPVMASDLQEAEQLMGKLGAMLGQAGDDSGAGAPSFIKSIEMRDRFWTLLKQRHDVLWRCGAWLYGRVADERVPPLPDRQAAVSKVRGGVSERETARAAAEPRRSIGPPSLVPARVSPPTSTSPRDTSRHLTDLQRELERKTRFFVRMGIIPSQR
ncbi:hypothetical protein [Stigmatella aurantiaca]|uniref:Uncharacterized protein n=1 Tax=Stigmatella aurantiaca (strain DW4/3-1) TaxID=378806 RepID=Q09CF2_STIAD|nr:hypothetical protein [Stigmatella aurantiaca]ADO69602.1 uncharacterized protein STAUR_1798 [Stigmatella aurantiaca DW4/3-1]EAU69447.1 hypothetical protein STIAU_3685 [Stigmatella aurantiaca DW4/3-1]